MKVWGTLHLALLAMALFGATAAVVTAALYPRFRARLARSAPARRGRWILALVALPVVAAVGLTALCFVPKALDLLVPVGDHCLHHGNEHPHFCLEHLSPHSGALAGWILLAAAAAWAASRMAGFLARSVPSWRAGRQLARAAAFDAQRGVWLLPCELPLALTTGVRRPRAMVSAGLLRSLAPELAEVVVEHERAHARRRDVLRGLVAGLLSLAHLPGTRRMLLADLALAAEQACDEEAGARLGDRLRVAQALLAVERLLHEARRPVGLSGVSFGGSAVPPRVASLLAEAPADRAGARGRGWLPLAAVVLLGLLADPLHHWTETILGLLGG